MRILRLDLLAFGPFAGQSLPLDGGHFGLHLVYGPNEAGKSSALRALTQLLYGIPHNSPDNFITSYRNMRIGALLQAADDTLLECIRRKGRTGTLRGPDDAEVIEPARLEQMLGGVNQETFEQRFGIDYGRLVAGGRAIVEGSGELGEILFAAGAGMANLEPVQKRLADQAEALFKPRGKNLAINQALVELAAARQAIRAAQLPSSEWVRHDKTLRQARAQVTGIEAELLARRAEKGRLERIRDALPMVTRRDKVLGELGPVADAVILPDAFSEQRRQTAAALAEAHKSQRDASEQIASIDQAMAQLHVPAPLLEHRTAIQQLHTDLGSYHKAVHDRPRLVVQRQQLEDEATTILTELGREPDLEQAAGLRVSRPERLRIQNLGNERSALVAQHDAARATVRDADDQIRRTQQRLQALAEPRDAGPLRQALRRVQRHGELGGQLAAAGKELRQAEQQAAVDLEKLPLWSGTLAALEKLALPPVETVDRFLADLDAAETQCKGLAERTKELATEALKLDGKKEQLRLKHDVPTEDELAAARRRRDEGWRLVLHAWREDHAGEAVSEFIARLAPVGDLARAYEVSVEQADQLADRLRREADRVAEKAQLIADEHKLDARLADLRQKLRVAEQGREDVQRQWQELWRPLGIEPLAPREMRAWFARQSDLVIAAESIRRRQGEMAELAGLVESARAELSTALVQAGERPAGKKESLQPLLERCEEAAARIEAQRDERQTLERDRGRFQRELADAERLVADSQQALDRWRGQWAEAMTRLGLDDSASPAEANSVLDAIHALHEKLAEAEQLRERIEGIDDDDRRFNTAVRRLTDLVAADLSDLPLEQAVADLHDRLAAAQADQARLDELSRQRGRETAKQQEARTECNRLEAALGAMCREAECETADKLAEAEERSRRRQALELERRQLDDQLAQLAGGMSLEQFVAEAGQVDPDQLQPRIQQLADDIGQREQERSEVLQTIGSEKTVLERMDGSAQAAEARQRVEQLLARVRADTEQYVRLRLAAAVLRGAVERYRQKHQGPVLRRAGELFAELTRGSFVGLRPDYNDQGAAVLVGVRPDGATTVGVQGFSDGTESQLYLALRIASLERYLAANEPLPFIVDDILKDFDDDRAVAALKVLARLAERTQVVLFTHHAHLVQLASDNLDDDVLFTQRLPAPGTPAAAANAASRA